MKKQSNISSFFYPNPVVLVTVENESGEESIITISWAGTCCSKPPYISIAIRPERFSHHIIMDSKEFIANFPIKEQLEQVKLCGSKSGKDINKWEETNFTKSPSINIKTPGIKECPVSMECRVEKIINLGTHDLFIAEVVGMQIDEKWKSNGFPGMLTFTNGQYGIVEK